MPLNFRAHRRRVKPMNRGLRYDPGYWGRVALPLPQGFWPNFGPGHSGKTNDYSPNAIDGAFSGSGISFAPGLYGMSLSCAGTGTPVVSANWNPPAVNAIRILFSAAAIPASSSFACPVMAVVAAGSPYYGFLLTNSNQLQVWSEQDGVTGTIAATVGVNTLYDAWLVRLGNSVSGGLKLYVNGTLANSINTGSGWSGFTGTGNFGVGNQAHSLGRPLNGNVYQVSVFGAAPSASQIAKAYSQPWAMFGTRDVGFVTSGGPASTTGAGMLSARPTLVASSIFGGFSRVAASQSDIASSIYGAEGHVVSTKTIIASSVKAAAAGIHASMSLIASSLRAASASIQASAVKSVTHNLASGEATLQARSAEIASSILAAVAHIRAQSSQTNQQAIAALAHFAATASPHVLTNLLAIQERLSAAATEINHTTRTAAGSLAGEAVSAVTLNLKSLAEHVEALAAELASSVDHPGAGGGARATVIASNPCHAHSGIGAAAQVFTTSGQVAVTAWALVTPKVQATINVEPKALAEVDVGY